MTRSARLRVGVAVDLLDGTSLSGHGRVWTNVLASLDGPARLIRIDPGTGRQRRRLGPGPQALLADGHAPVPPARVPTVVQVHEAGWFDPDLRALLDPDFLASITESTNAALSRADHVITPSDAARQDVVDGYRFDPARVHAVPHGVDPAFTPNARGGRELVARRRGGAAGPYVLYAAMLHPRKNLAVVREAMAALAEEGLPHALVVAGGPASDRPDSSDLELAAAAELPGAPGRIVRIERPTDVELAGLMAEADAFCLPSLYEGFGLTALEAMACGAPVVVSDRGALPEVAGEAAIVVPPTAEAVTGALRELVTDPDKAASLGAAAAARAREFTWERTATGWLEVLRSAVEGAS